MGIVYGFVVEGRKTLRPNPCSRLNVMGAISDPALAAQSTWMKNGIPLGRKFSLNGYKNNITAYHHMISPNEFTIFVYINR
jgi:hypothetical protein